MENLKHKIGLKKPERKLLNCFSSLVTPLCSGDRLRLDDYRKSGEQLKMRTTTIEDYLDKADRNKQLGMMDVQRNTPEGKFIVTMYIQESK